jgi:hypothetical protein
MARDAERKANCSSSSDDKAVVIFPMQFQKRSSAPARADLTFMPRQRRVQPEMPPFYCLSCDASQLRKP